MMFNQFTRAITNPAIRVALPVAAVSAVVVFNNQRRFAAQAPFIDPELGGNKSVSGLRAPQPKRVRVTEFDPSWFENCYDSKFDRLTATAKDALLKDSKYDSFKQANWEFYSYKDLVELYSTLPPRITHLDLGHAALHMRTGFALVQLFGAINNSIKKLTFNAHRLTDPAPIAAALSAITAPLETLEINMLPLSSMPSGSSVQILSALPDTIKTLKLPAAFVERTYKGQSGEQLPMAECVAGLKALPDSIEVLDLSYCELGNRNAIELGEFFAAVKAKKLILAHNNLGNLSAKGLAYAISRFADNVEEIDFYFNDLGKYSTEEMVLIASAFKSTVKKLQFQGCKLGFQTSTSTLPGTNIAEFFRILDCFHADLEILDISYNYLKTDRKTLQTLFNKTARFKEVKLDSFEGCFDGSSEEQMLTTLSKTHKSITRFTFRDFGVLNLEINQLKKVLAVLPATINELSYVEMLPSVREWELQVSERERAARLHELVAITPSNVKRLCLRGCLRALSVYQTKQLFAAIPAWVEAISISDIECSDTFNNEVKMIIALKAIKPAVKLLDLQGNKFDNVTVDRFIAILKAIPDSVEKVLFDHNFSEYNQFTQEDFHKLQQEFPGLCGDLVGKPIINTVWNRTSQPKLRLSM